MPEFPQTQIKSNSLKGSSILGAIDDHVTKDQHSDNIVRDTTFIFNLIIVNFLKMGLSRMILVSIIFCFSALRLISSQG